MNFRNTGFYKNLLLPLAYPFQDFFDHIFTKFILGGVFSTFLMIQTEAQQILEVENLLIESFPFLVYVSAVTQVMLWTGLNGLVIINWFLGTSRAIWKREFKIKKQESTLSKIISYNFYALMIGISMLMMPELFQVVEFFFYAFYTGRELYKGSLTLGLYPFFAKLATVLKKKGSGLSFADIVEVIREEKE